MKSVTILVALAALPWMMTLPRSNMDCVIGCLAEAPPQKCS